jgi:predicted DNA-binding protein
MNKVKSLRVSARVSASDKKKIAALAKKTKQTVADYIRERILTEPKSSVKTYRRG